MAGRWVGKLSAAAARWRGHALVGNPGSFSGRAHRLVPKVAQLWTYSQFQQSGGTCSTPLMDEAERCCDAWPSLIGGYC